jgi:hypothetical protein
MRPSVFALPVLLPLLAVLPAAWSSPARACGGTFCDTGPNQMPVDQTGENILFILEPGQVEVHIQIQYDPNTNAQKFAWMIPLPEVPEFDVGSELLFRELLRATVPTYGLQTSFDFCGDDSGGVSTLTGGGTTTSDGTSGGEPPPDVDVIKVESVGAFEVVVLAGKSAPELMQWLGDNGYQQDPNAEPILQQYLDEGNNIVAFKLGHAEGIKSIHPIVLRYPGADGCVPIRLTRIAAVDDMDIRVFALADGRAIPTNYRHVLVNPLKIDWLSLGSNYKEVISMAVDAFGAEGHAFVTEYAGNTGPVDPFAFHSDQWDAAAFSGLPATEAINVLNQQGLASCYDTFFCEFTHPLIESMLAAYLPVPDGLTREEFYGDLAAHEAMIDPMLWANGEAFSKDMITRVIDPAAHARTLIETWPYLTRMYTTISPAEMTEDPLFLFNPELPNVASLRIASQNVDCNDHAVVTLPDGRQVHKSFGSSWPDFPGEMPWEEDVDQMVPMGMPQPLIDNTPLIDKLLAEWNQAHKPTPPDPTTGGTPTTSDTGGTSDGTGGATGDGTGSDGDTGDSATGAGQGGTGEGCGCREGQPGSTWLALLALLALPRRRARA